MGHLSLRAAAGVGGEKRCWEGGGVKEGVGGGRQGEGGGKNLGRVFTNNLQGGSVKTYLGRKYIIYMCPCCF